MSSRSPLSTARSFSALARSFVVLTAAAGLAACGQAETAPAASPYEDLVSTYAPSQPVTSSRPSATADKVPGPSPERRLTKPRPVSPETTPPVTPEPAPKFPAEVDPVHGKKQWHAVVAVAPDSTDRKIRTAERRLAKVGYRPSTGQCIRGIAAALGTDVVSPALANSQPMYVTVTFPSSKAAAQFATAYEQKFGTATLGSVHLPAYCMD